MIMAGDRPIGYRRHQNLLQSASQHHLQHSLLQKETVERQQFEIQFVTAIDFQTE